MRPDRAVDEDMYITEAVVVRKGVSYTYWQAKITYVDGTLDRKMFPHNASGKEAAIEQRDTWIRLNSGKVHKRALALLEPASPYVHHTPSIWDVIESALAKGQWSLACKLMRLYDADSIPMHLLDEDLVSSTG